VFVHCSANFWPSLGVVLEAADKAAAEAAYRKGQSVPPHIVVACEEVAKLPNGSFAKVRKTAGDGE
jgi:hypothetical protein